MNRFYGMGEWGNALCGMDDAGEMSSWYVFAAMGLYPYSPADPEFIVSVPLFDEVNVSLSSTESFSIKKLDHGKKITQINLGETKLDSYFIQQNDLLRGKELYIHTQ